MFASSRRPVRHFAMSGVDDDKWRRALLKKLRAAVAVKTRVDAGDASSLQKTQVGKGSKKAIDDVLAKLKAAGLGRDAAEVRAAFATGKSEGESAMSAAAKRGPDGGADGTPSKKRLKREARASRRPDDGRVSRGGGDDARAPRPASEARNPGVSGHQFAACKRAVLALHALAKNPGSPDPHLADALRALTPKLAAAADARLASVALWSLAKSAQRALHPDDAANLARLAAALTDRVAAVARDMDARGLSTSLWSLASLATDATRSWNRSETAATTTRTARFDAATAATAARPLIRALSGGANGANDSNGAKDSNDSKDSNGSASASARCNPQDAANALWACAKLRRAPPPRVAAELARRVAVDDAEPMEMSMALWALASLRADGTLPTAASAAEPLAKAAAAKARADGSGSGSGSGSFSPQAAANASWAVGKLIGGIGDGFFGDGDDDGGGIGTDEGVGIPGGSAEADAKEARAKSSSEMVSASRDLVSSFATISASAPPGAYSPRQVANILWACASVGASRDAVAPLARAALELATAAGRRAAAKRAGRGVAPETIERPSPEDVAAAIEALERAVMGKGDVGRNAAAETLDDATRAAVRSAVSSALTAPTNLDWRAAGRLEHATFATLGDIESRAAASASGLGPRASADDRAVIERLLRRGADAARAADDERLVLEEGAVAALLDAGDAGPIGRTPSGARVLCVDDTHRLASLPLREAGWTVTNWNRFARRDRAGSAWPPAIKSGARLFDAATVRLPPTKAAFAMAIAAAAARTAEGATVWVYGAATEGIRTVPASFPAELFADVAEIRVVAVAGRTFAVVRATRTAAPIVEGADDHRAHRSAATLHLPAPNDEDSSASDPIPWTTYPGLFAGGGLDVMTAFMLRAMPTSATRHARAVLDFCSGSGVLAAAIRRRAPRARVTLLDADAAALAAARENLAGCDPPCAIVSSDGWSGLAADETFDVIVSNPPVHLGLQPEFSVLAALVKGCAERLNPGGSCWFVAQRYVPVGAVCAEAGEERARCVAVDDRFAVWRVDRDDRDDASGPARKKEKSAKREKKSRKDEGKDHGKDKGKDKGDTDEERSKKRSKKASRRKDTKKD